MLQLIIEYRARLAIAAAAAAVLYIGHALTLAAKAAL